MRVGYKSPQALLQAFAQSMGQGVVRLPARRKVTLGTRFLFELHLKKLPKPLEVEGEVIEVQPDQPSNFQVTVRYHFGADRTALDAALQELFEDHQRDTVRAHARVPMHLAAQDTSGADRYLITNLSEGGAGLEVRGALPADLVSGAPALLQVTSSEGLLSLPGAVAWIKPPSDPAPSGGAESRASLGIRFGKLQKPTALSLDRLLILYALPLSGWRVTVSFGPEAISRMV
jgi:Tfp pilus assembly protein PilZ